MSPSKTVLIKSGRLVDSDSGRDETADLLIRSGRIASIAKRIAKPEGAQILDARGKVVVPGLVDMHVHLREPGREDEETVLTGAQAAAAGGFTAVACMPNTEPPIDTQETVRFIYERASQAPVRVFPVGAVTRGRRGNELTEMADLVAAGVVAVSDDGCAVTSAEIMRRALEYASMFDIPVISHCEDLTLSGTGVMHEGYVSTVLGLKGIPALSEEVMVARDIRLAEFAGARLHIAHVSAAGSVELIRSAKARGVRVTAETTPHHFTLTDEAVRRYDTNTKVNPPLRSAVDRQAIRDGLADGTIDCIASDHAPHSAEEKELEYDAAPFGMIGLETSLGLVLTELVAGGVLDLMAVVSRMSLSPSRILGIEGGVLRKGAPADLTVIDPQARWTVDRKAFRSRSKNTPFDRWELTGRTEATIVGGRIVFRRSRDEK
jgi:dihydroorotase